MTQFAMLGTEMMILPDSFSAGMHLSQYGRGIAQMLQDIREHDVIEFPPVGKFKAFDIRDLKGVVILPRFFGGRRIEFNPRHVMAAPLQIFPRYPLAVPTSRIRTGSFFAPQGV